MRKLNEIIDCKYSIMISDIKTDSREVKKGDLFVSIKGYNVDHNLFIDDAIKNGAVAIVTSQSIKKDIPVITVENIEDTLVEICQKFYGVNSLNLIGITGTDGKTTTATIIKKLLEYKTLTAYIGTNGLMIYDQYQKTDNTTPTIEKLYSYLHQIKQKHCENVVLEVSSEALLHKRVDSLKFKYAIYTNITEDHLNIHKTVDNYIKVKNRLISLLDNNGICIVNFDDVNCNKLIIPESVKKITYGKDVKSDFRIDNISINKDNTTFDIINKNNIYHIESPFLGEYNIYNLTSAFIICVLEGMDTNIIISLIKKLPSVPGRNERLDFGQNYQIVLDYAHTENGIKKLIESKKNYNKKIVVVTGQAGGREKEKRKKIGKYLLNNSDFVIFTMDDPRYESVDSIINEMIGDSKSKNYIKIIDRKEAINYALSNANEDDIILILGKGRDNYMAIEDKKIQYCDYDVIKNYFNK